MKKILLLGLAITLLSMPAHAECPGGEEWTAGGTTFCRSLKTMNWWTAFAWCKGNGFTLATIQKACPERSDDYSPNTSDVCAIVFGPQYKEPWTATPWGTEQALYITGATWSRQHIGAANRTVKHPALCIE